MIVRIAQGYQSSQHSSKPNRTRKILRPPPLLLRRSPVPLYIVTQTTPVSSSPLTDGSSPHAHTASPELKRHLTSDSRRIERQPHRRSMSTPMRSQQNNSLLSPTTNHHGNSGLAAPSSNAPVHNKQAPVAVSASALPTEWASRTLAALNSPWSSESLFSARSHANSDQGHGQLVSKSEASHTFPSLISPRTPRRVQVSPSSPSMSSTSSLSPSSWKFNTPGGQDMVRSAPHIPGSAFGSLSHRPSMRRTRSAAVLNHGSLSSSLLAHPLTPDDEYRRGAASLGVAVRGTEASSWSGRSTLVGSLRTASLSSTMGGSADSPRQRSHLERTLSLAKVVVAPRPSIIEPLPPLPLPLPLPPSSSLSSSSSDIFQTEEHLDGDRRGAVWSPTNSERSQRASDSGIRRSPLFMFRQWFRRRTRSASGPM